MIASPPDQGICFGPYLLEIANARLLRDGEAVSLTPKALDVLHHLATRPGRLVTKDELLSALWADVIVSDASIKVCIREIRRAIGDGVKSPTYIQTVYRRGYRFIAPVREAVMKAEAIAPIAPLPSLPTALLAEVSSQPRGAEKRRSADNSDEAASDLCRCVFVPMNLPEARIFVFPSNR